MNGTAVYHSQNLTGLAYATNLKTLNLGVADVQRVNNNSISDISALSSLTSLEYLYLDNNNISDISALSSLTSLEYLGLYNNSISNLAPLVTNTGLGSGSKVFVGNNPLSPASTNTHIPTLQGRGVSVQLGAPKPAVGGALRRMPRALMNR